MILRLFNRKAFAQLLLAFLLLGIFAPIVLGQVVPPVGTSISAELRLIPTSLFVTPTVLSIDENSGPHPGFTAIARFDYPGATIADKDVSSDDLTVWTTSNNSVALVTKSAMDVVVTPVSDLGTGAAPVLIIATYGGISGQSSVTVTGNVVVPPIDNGGGGGGGGNYDNPPPPDNGGGENPPADNGGGETPPADNGGGQTPPADNGGGETPPADNGGGQTPPADNGGGETPPADNGGGQTPTSGNGGDVPREIFGQEQSPYLPLEGPVRDDQIVPESLAPIVPQDAPPGGVSRAIVAKAIADKLKVLELRRNLLERCYADLENCTNIFRMFSKYDGIKLDAKDLRLFPDVNDLNQKNEINESTLLGIWQGYYGIEGSPFLPNKSISKVEMLKVLSSVLVTFEKGDPDYKPGKFDFTTLFYQEIYAASLLVNQTQSKVTAMFSVPKSVMPVMRIAHALSDEAWNLIRAQTTPFKDVRPDLLDSHWYYPIVYNKLCSQGLISCQPGSEAKPDDTPTVDELNYYISIFDSYIKAQNLDKNIVKDDDDDGILNIDETVIYFTSPLLADSDSDNLKDGEEINKYKTNPNSKDTDEDKLSDGEEISKYKTNPNVADTDEDSFSDWSEIQEGSDPLDKSSTPDDVNKNGVSDKWEVENSVEVLNGSQDTDKDGVSDLLEFQYGTDPSRVDTDRDGYTDSEEILDLLTDPNDPNSPGSVEDLPVLINNFQYGQLVSESSPLIKGVGPASLGDNVVKIQILLRNEFGSELQLGQTTTDAKGGFLFVPDIEIKNGTYFLLARAINKAEVKLSKPIKIIVDTSLQVATAKPEKLENTPIEEDVYLKKLVLKVDSKDGQPVLYGTLSEFGSRVNVTWQSLVVSSALIVDATDGSFSVKAPKLATGRHTVYVQTIRKRDGAMGKTLKISFDLGVSPVVNLFNAESPSLGSVLQQSGKNAVEFIAKQSWPFWLGLVVFGVLIGGGFYFFALDRDDKEKKKKR